MSRFPMIRGLIAATHSPFHDDGSIHLDVVSLQLAGLLNSGVTTSFICGTTGESHSLTVPERLAVTRRWGEIARGTPMHVIAHVGHNCQQDAITLAKGAADSRLHGIAAVAPSYFKPASVGELIRFFQPVAAAAPELPFYFYDIPSITGVALSATDFLEQARGAIPNLAGIKFTNADTIELQSCLRQAEGEFDILYGIDEALLSGLVLGIRGAVGSTFNFAASISLNVIRAFEQGNLEQARSEQNRTIRLVRLLAGFGYLAAAKCVMALLGVPVGPVRSPVRPLTMTEKQQLEQRLKDSEFADLLSQKAT
ncbi:dihydrodipicolinate synthase family protein [Planctomicrobium sp. SH664]|uniref:dihydrodipicolinate synthase family protein n=1 Tax=Planctomicrobium sp. SH664 TaxID=3448125 RepID=UPI003F5C3A74